MIFKGEVMKIRVAPRVVVIFFSLLALAVPLRTSAQFSFTTNDSTLTITGYTGSGGNVVIPATINGIWVSTIGTGAFSNQTSITSLTISYPVSSISNWAFASCSNLTNVVVDGSVARLGKWVFANCASLQRVEFQGDVPTVNGGLGSADSTLFLNDSNSVIYYLGNLGWTATFGGLPTTGVPNPLLYTYTTGADGLTITGFLGLGGNVIIPETINGYPVIGIDHFAFWNQAITSLAIPKSVLTIGAYALTGCPLLTNITVDAANPNFASVGGVLFDKSVGTLLQFPPGRGGSYTVPDGVITLAGQSFTDCSNLVNIIIANSVTTIQDQAFVACSGLTSVTLGGGVSSLGIQVFGGCSSLTNISVDPANTNFASAGGVWFDKSMTTLIEYPGGKAGDYAIPNGVTTIGQYAFSQCDGLTALTMPSSLTTISDWGIQYCSGLKNLTFGSGVTSIGYAACWYCSGLTNVTMDAALSSVGGFAFSYCTNLHRAFFSGNAPTANGGAGVVDNTVFYGETGTVYYVPGTVGWSDSFGGWPTAHWYQPQPKILTSGNGDGMQNDAFEFTISWATNTTVVVEASPDLKSWTPVWTNMLVNGTNVFCDSACTNHPQQFYRVRSQ
jgi:hypothetical protein